MAPILPVTRIDRGRAEVAQQAVRRMERALGGPAQAQVQRQVSRELPIVLEIQAVDGVARQPGRGVSSEVGLRARCPARIRRAGCRCSARVAVGLQAGGHVVELEDAAGLPELEVIGAEDTESRSPILNAWVPMILLKSSRKERVSRTVRDGPRHGESVHRVQGRAPTPVPDAERPN